MQIFCVCLQDYNQKEQRVVRQSNCYMAQAKEGTGTGQQQHNQAHNTKELNQERMRVSLELIDF